MVHGTSAYFLERSRFSRRLSLITLGVSLVAMGTLGLTYTPPVRRVLRSTVRFGYEGPDQYVRRITLQQNEGQSSVISDPSEGMLQMRRRGGARRASRTGEGQPTPRSRFSGAGTFDRDVSKRSVSRSSGVPVVRSEDLVIDRLVRPEYPPRLLEQNIEGRVTLQALIDTVGRVVSVQVMASSGERLFEQAAEEAVWQCRFRPYRPDGRTASEVFAVFRFAFRIY
jgi:TonB family protein